MVRTLELKHAGFEAKVPQVKRVKKRDWNLSILESVDDFKIERFQEYKELDFPVWKRAMMEGIDLPDYSKKVEFSMKGFKMLDCDPEVFEIYDFEGSDRKYVLLADIFNNFDLCAKVSGDSRLDLEFSNLSIERVYLEAHGSARIVRKVQGKGTRITSERIVVKSNSKLEIVEVLDIDGVNISNVYFHLEEGAEMVIKHLSKSGGKSVEYYLAVLRDDSSLTIDHRTVQKSGVTDALFFEKIEGRNSKARVDAKGAVKSGKVIFRGMMDLPKGVEGVDASESFKLFCFQKTRLSKPYRAYSRPRTSSRRSTEHLPHHFQRRRSFTCRAGDCRGRISLNWW